MSHTKMLLHFSSILFFVASMCGLMWQLVLVCELYFQYKVITAINITIPEKIPPVGTTFCTRFTDVLDFDRMAKATGRDWKYSTRGPDIQKYQDEMTVKEIFDFTPDVMQTVKRLVYRKNNSYERIEYDGPSVYEYVEVTKYIYLEHVCYRFGITNAQTMSYSYYAVTPAAAGTIYEIFLNDSLSQSDLVKISMHNQNTLPYRSLKVQPVIWRQYDHEITKKAKYNTFSSYQIRLMSELLKSPYETNCYDYTPRFKSDAHCVNQCVMEKSLKQLDHVPFSVLITDASINFTMISVIDIKNDSIVQQLLAIERTCAHQECFKKQCDMATTMTTTTAIVAEEFGLQTTVTSRPWISVTASPCLNLVEFLTYIMSVFSTWTGLSIMSLLPSKIVRVLKYRDCPHMIGKLSSGKHHHHVRRRSDRNPISKPFSLPPIA